MINTTTTKAELEAIIADLGDNVEVVTDFHNKAFGPIFFIIFKEGYNDKARELLHDLGALMNGHRGVEVFDWNGVWLKEIAIYFGCEDEDYAFGKEFDGDWIIDFDNYDD